jgi:dUTP pyrophosphatase
MRVRISRVDLTLPLPEYATSGAVAFDLYARHAVRVAPGSLARIPTNLIVQVPDGYALVLALRSSTPSRKGLLKPNGVGIIDQDFHGPDDELQLQVYNFTSEPVTVDRGERIGQGLLIPIDRVEWDEGDPEGPSRGGFGATGY